MKVTLAGLCAVLGFVAGLAIGRWAMPCRDPLPFDSKAWRSVTSTVDPGRIRWRMRDDAFRRAVDERWSWKRAKDELGEPDEARDATETDMDSGAPYTYSWALTYRFVYPNWSLYGFETIGVLRLKFGKDGHVDPKASVLSSTS